jgi:hypothetical protein
MAEAKNSFLKSRMNQDLDDRLVPNGEYRYANNISVGKSEADDIGALQNMLGNELLALTDNSEFIPGTTTPNPNYIPGLECIGSFMDNQNNRIFQFLTDYTDPDPNNIILPTEGNMKITMYDLDSPESYTTLVQGLFLNFAKNKEFRITGVNLIEGLLFWTDNRNQPRKINVSSALNPNYYTREEQISVAKYAPVDPITLYKKVTATVEDASLSPIIVLDGEINIVPGMTVISETISGADYVVVVDVDIDTILSTTTITLYEEPPVAIIDGEELTFLISTMTDKSSVPSWPGDPAFLEDKYVRFSYRFKYDDNEYSLMAPFTQIAYIPKQKGYFIAGNETDAYRSTIINWFENNINNIELIIPLPDRIGRLTSNYKIKEIDILYKESNSLAIKVFETLAVSSMNTQANTNNNYYIQPYQSQKPYKTLPEDQNIRVYDKVPVRAKAQESSGNRIIYGNYYDKYTCLSSINYNISIQPKSPIGTNFIEYPNHTLKKNRNYQVGFVLADKFGRQSPVILSSVDLLGAVVNGIYTKGSTVYSSYENSVLFEDVRTWFGDTLILYLNSPIDQQKDISAGMPGLYAIPTSNSGFAITALVETVPNEYTFTLDLTAPTSNYVPEVGNILRGKYVDYVEVLTSVITYETPGDPLTPIVSVTITTSDSIGDIYNYNDPGGDIADIKFSYIYNPIGWYSYKIVVKQQEEDYYNVYLPGMLNGYPKNQTSGSQVVYTGTASTPTLQNGINTTQFPVSETGNTAHIVLINDNINKVPRDLSEVGPDQKQYRSSIQLYGRVENVEDSLTIIGNDPDYSAKVIKIFYDTDTVGNEDWALIKPGDGIQCLEANEPIDNPDPAFGGTIPNPYRWLGDTVVVSNVVGGTNGTITLSSPNWIIDTGNPTTTYKTFRITRAENKQYFPTRKADTVISIATGAEFNFLDNSVDNLSGTAALNFYQLQNSPLIGRVSTINKIGVMASDMIPFLSVYETKPTQTILELFWETATTGLISDLNSDVLTGFDGPSSFGEVNYIHFENQDPYGDGEGTGEYDSKWITDEFAVLNQNGIILPNTTVTLVSVFDSTNQDRLDDFGLEPITTGLEATYRLYIKKPGPPDNAGDFVFNNNAGTLESYVFTFNVVDIDNPSTSTNLTINGRLGNNNPIITIDVFDYAITQVTTDITTLTAVNGSYSNAVTGLKWSIIGGDTTPPSFNIHPYTGLLTLTNDQIPLGIYELEIKVEDAVNTSNGETLPPEDTDFGTLSSTTTLTINVGDEPVPYWLRPLFGPSTTVYGGTQCNQQLNPYGMIYIGKRTNFGTGYSYLPEIPSSGRNYQIVRNVEIVNAQSQGVSSPGITGLTTGAYRVKMTLYVPLPPACNPGSVFVTTVASFSIYLYRRVYNPSNSGGSGWVLVETQNNTLNNSPSGPNYTSPILTVSTGQDEKLITTSFTIEADPNTEYEWAVGVKVIRGATSSNDKGPGAFVYFEGEDANYSYDQTTPNFTTPLLVPYTYYTGVERVDGSTSAIPYTTLDATRGISYSSLNNPIASGAIEASNLIVNLTLSTANPQSTPGLRATIIKSGSMVGFGKIVSVGTINPAQLTIQLDSTFPAVSSLSGGTLELTAINANPPAIGALYANTIEGTEIKRFYTDAGFTQKWIPPFSGKYYVFQTVKNYAPNKPSKFTDYPYYCARFNEDGEVIEQTPYTPNSQTAWKGGQAPTTTFFNYGYNMYYEEPPLP